jgi:hypothetical protein
MFGIEAITPTDFRSRFRRGLTLTLVAVAAWLAAPTASRASVTDYAFSNAGAVLNGTPVSISGLFSVSENEVPGFTVQFFSSIQVTGPAPYAGLYTCSGTSSPGTSPAVCSLTPILAPDEIVGVGFQIRFADNLSSDADPLASVEINGVTDTAPTGAAVPIATPIDYEVNGSTVLNGAHETISGDFEYDPLTLIQYRGGEISVTGPAPYAGQYQCDDTFPTNGRTIVECVVIDFPPTFVFANDLGLAADPLASVEINGVTDTAPTGEAVPGGGGPIPTLIPTPIPTPEPTSLAILGVALGLFIVSPWAIRRAAQSHADQPEGA